MVILHSLKKKPDLNDLKFNLNKRGIGKSVPND